MFLAKEQDNKNLHEEIKSLNININECQKRESSLKDQFEVRRQDMSNKNDLMKNIYQELSATRALIRGCT
jgi:chromosome segregation ATPase